MSIIDENEEDKIQEIRKFSVNLLSSVNKNIEKTKLIYL